MVLHCDQQPDRYRYTGYQQPGAGDGRVSAGWQRGVDVESFGWDHLYGDSANPWEDPYTRHANGSLAFFYPPRRAPGTPNADFTITPSLRLATFRESVDDFEYARILEDLVKAGRDKSVDTVAAERTLLDIRRFFPENTNWSQNAAWFLELRDRIARQIIALRARLAD